LTFNEVCRKYELYQRNLKGLIKEVRSFIIFVKEFIQSQLKIAMDMEDVYLLSSHPRPPLYPAFKDFKRFLNEPDVYTLETELDAKFFKHTDILLSLFEEPDRLILKRNRKQLDFDRCRDTEKRGEKIDKRLKENADAYVALNAQLIDELPPFLNFASLYLQRAVVELMQIQTRFYESMSSKMNRLCDRHEIVTNVNIVEDYFTKIADAASKAPELTIISNWNKAKVNLDQGSQAVIRKPSTKIATQMPKSDSLAEQVESSTAQSPIIPAPTPQYSLVKALFDYEGEKDDELSFKKGEIIKIMEWQTDEIGWLSGELNGKFGFLPKNFVTERL